MTNKTKESTSITTTKTATPMVPKFDGTEYVYWRLHIEDYLHGKNLYVTLQGKPEGMVDREWCYLNRYTVTVIQMALPNQIACVVTKRKIQ